VSHKKKNLKHNGQFSPWWWLTEPRIDSAVPRRQSWVRRPNRLGAKIGAFVRITVPAPPDLCEPVSGLRKKTRKFSDATARRALYTPMRFCMYVVCLSVQPPKRFGAPEPQGPSSRLGPRGSRFLRRAICPNFRPLATILSEPTGLDFSVHGFCRSSRRLSLLFSPNGANYRHVDLVQNTDPSSAFPYSLVFGSDPSRIAEKMGRIWASSATFNPGR